MHRTGHLRRQHAAALDIASALGAAAASSAWPSMAEAREIVLDLARLTEGLDEHISQEQADLYPSLIASGDAAVTATVHRFVTEMDLLGAVYGVFARQWSTASAILADPHTFKDECGTVMGLLVTRIRREDDELYPLADNDGGSVGAA